MLKGDLKYGGCGGQVGGVRALWADETETKTMWLGEKPLWWRWECMSLVILGHLKIRNTIGVALGLSACMGVHANPHATTKLRVSLKQIGFLDWPCSTDVSLYRVNSRDLFFILAVAASSNV
jgi:hypothetical protein